jgi:D-alanyl-D-alanine carboxypeptidase (penicillin-binding protein 5/6)
MKRIRAILVLNFFAFTMAFAQGPAAPALTAKSWLLFDASSDQVIAAHEPGMRIEPASLAKLMTAYLACAAVDKQKISLSQMIDVSNRAWKVDHDGSRMFIEPGKPVSFQDLLYGLIVQSGNDAAVALAEALSGTEEAFVAEMNRTAKVMGLTATRFANSHGLPSPDNFSSARDLAILATHVIYDYPDCYKIYAVRSFTYNKIAQANRNRLLAPEAGVDGIKTGYTEASGYSLITSASRTGEGSARRLIAIVLGAPSGNARAQDSQKLLNWGFRNFESIKLYAGGTPVSTPMVWKGVRDQVKVGFGEDILVTVPKSAAKKLKPVLELNTPLLAPIAAGSRVGQMKVVADNVVLSTRPVIALENVEQAGFLARMSDGAWLWITRQFQGEQKPVISAPIGSSP